MSVWDLLNSPNHEWFGVCYANDSGKYVAVGTNNVMTSFDGSKWDDVPDIPTGTWKSVCSKTDMDVFVAVGGDVNGGKVMISDNNVSTWFDVSGIPSSETWNSVCYGYGYDYKFVAVGTNEIMYSSDGYNWYNNVSGVPTRVWNSVCTGLINSSNIYVAVGDSSGVNNIIWSNDGIEWNDVSGVPSGESWKSVCYGSTKGFVAVSDNIAIYSTDGISWNAFDNFTTGTWNSIGYGAEVYVVVGDKKEQTYDGTNWTLGAKVPTGENGDYDVSGNGIWNSVCYGSQDTGFVAVSSVSISLGDITGNVMTNQNGKKDCFLKGTKILCLVNGIKTYVPIENIKLGDLIKTYKHGYKPVKQVKYSKMTNNPYNTYSCLYKHIDSKLIVTGRHLVLLDNDKISKKNIYTETKKYRFNDKIKCIRDFIEDNKFYWFGNSKIDNKYTIHACNLDSFEKVKTTKTYEIYHLVLGSGKRRYGIYSEGILTGSNI